MAVAAAGFDWDDGNRAKCLRHGVSIEEIESLFSSSIALFPDARHSKSEDRVKAIGTSATGRYFFAVFTFRKRGDETLIRPISARYMHRKEVAHYERQKAEAEETSGSQDR